MLSRRRLLWGASAALGAMLPLPSMGDAARPMAVAEGDLLFRKAEPSIATQLIQQVSPLRPALWTHVGIVHVGSDGEPLVIHALPEEGVLIQRMSHFVAPQEAHALALVRSGQEGIGGAMSMNARLYLGRPFDHKMRISESNQIYCTELVALALNQVNLHFPFQTIWVPTYPEPILHPDTLYSTLLKSRQFSLIGTRGVDAS